MFAGSPIIVVRVVGPNGVQKPNPVLVKISGFQFQVSTTTPIEKLNLSPCLTLKNVAPVDPKE